MPVTRSVKHLFNISNQKNPDRTAVTKKIFDNSKTV